MATGKAGAKAQKQEPQAPEEYLKDVAEQTLRFFDVTVSTALSQLEAETGKRSGGAGVLATPNTLTNERAAKNLDNIKANLVRELSQLAQEPAIARLVLRDKDGKDQIYFIARAGTLPSRISGATMASYRSPIGRLAALRVGDNEDVWTPKGPCGYELRERATLHPTPRDGGWDAPNTVLHSAGYRPLTIVSLRQLLDVVTPESADFLQSMIEADKADKNILDGISRAVRTKMGLRDQPLLDQIQDNIFRMSLNTQLVVLGPPGTGKTTTLIKRLGQKLDHQYLDDDERRLVGKTAAGADRHSQSWMMFTPTELLKQYVKEAFALEDIAASDERIKTWSDYRRVLARNSLAIWRTDVNNGPFIFRPNLDPFQSRTLSHQIEWFEAFEKAQDDDFWQELALQANRLAQSSDQNTSRLGSRLAAIVADDSSLAERFFAIAHLAEELQALANNLSAVTDDKIRGPLGRKFQQDVQLINRLMQFVGTLEDGTEDIDDSETEEEEDNRKPATRKEAIDACIRAIRAQARAAATGRSLLKTTRAGRLVEFLGGNLLPAEELKAIGASLQMQTAARRFLNPLRRYVIGIPRRYRRFRRECEANGWWYKKDGIARTDISPLETDAVILAILRASRALLKDIRIFNEIEHGPYAILQTIRELFRTQIVVDEATDFSPVQLACMAGLADPAADSFFACGDFNQRITSWGTRSAEELKWVASKLRFEPINISYRHSEQLNELAHRIALLSDAAAKKTKLPEDVMNGGVKPVLAKGLAAGPNVAEWLATRIGEIEILTGFMPSIAVLVNDEEQVVPLATMLDEALADRSIRAVACSRGQSVGQDNDVRVFDVQHIKGLEFEAVFFIGVDELAARLPDLFDKYLYVGTTRAATFLGVTTNGPTLPASIRGLEAFFQEGWK